MARAVSVCSWRCRIRLLFPFDRGFQGLFAIGDPRRRGLEGDLVGLMLKLQGRKLPFETLDCLGFAPPVLALAAPPWLSSAAKAFLCLAASACDYLSDLP